MERAGRGASKKMVRRGAVLAGERMFAVKSVLPVATAVMGRRMSPAEGEKVVR